MSKYVLAGIFFAFATAQAAATNPASNQSVEKSSSREGAWTVAPTLAAGSFSIKGSDISGSRSGMQAGAITNYQLANPDWQVETGLLYTQAGAKNDAILASVEYELNYLTVPIGVRYRLSSQEAGLSHWYMRGGLNLGYLMSAKSKAQVFGLGAEDDIKSKTNSFDVSPYVGVGTTWAMTDDQYIGLDFNYSRGLTKVFKDQASNNEALILGASYAFLF